MPRGKSRDASANSTVETHKGQDVVGIPPHLRRRTDETRGFLQTFQHLSYISTILHPCYSMLVVYRIADGWVMRSGRHYFAWPRLSDNRGCFRD